MTEESAYICLITERKAVNAIPVLAFSYRILRLPLSGPKRLMLGTALLAVIAVAEGCGLVPERVSLADPRVELMLRAMDQVDRKALGFTPIATNAQIRLELSSGGSYDAMLHVYGATSRTIAFRKTASGYRWISEQKIHEGPKWWRTVDGTFRESIVVEYQTEPVNGIPMNQLYIRYDGDDTKLFGRELTLSQVRPILEKWSVTPVEAKPPNIPEVGFEPFVAFMLLALFAVCCLALIIGAACLAIVAAMLAVGMISSSILIGVLQRSVSAGFRALFIQMGALAGMVVGAIVTCGLTWLTKWNWNAPRHWITGVALGFLTGILVGWLFNKVWGRIAQELTRNLERRRERQSR